MKESELLPTKPKSLTNFDPTKFRPDWAKQGRRARMQMATKCYDDVETAVYCKGVARVSLLAAVDDSRKVCQLCFHHCCQHCF